MEYYTLFHNGRKIKSFTEWRKALKYLEEISGNKKVHIYKENCFDGRKIKIPFYLDVDNLIWVDISQEVFFVTTSSPELARIMEQSNIYDGFIYGIGFRIKQMKME